jgi:hypothetical protein
LLKKTPYADVAPMLDERRYPDINLRTHGTKHVAFAVENLEDIVDSLKKRVRSKRLLGISKIRQNT